MEKLLFMVKVEDVDQKYHNQEQATSVDELPIPEFDNIGMEGVPLVQLINSNLYKANGSIKVDSILGYNPRYYA